MTLCAFCDRALAQSSILHQPACDSCSESIAAFYRGEVPSGAVACDEPEDDDDRP